ncbi:MULTISPECIES: NAD-dependent epimerase [Comamonas]|uniref:NAD-dependent epimerase n=1 Tax=Comamonas thiooxydans TaxID=363952 RepID=A0A5M3LU32_9BURK|nr:MULTISPECIES: NAD-dependent epimerase [Comamonas]ACY30854.1 NAD-dependent epimerase/dehydratase [Comamonas thiooxydans]EFI59601.1 NAD-dependent epimerase/dehydratase [Comamonas thiooxydans]KKI13298.1 capsular biosynthesis protein CpsI [Comamonas thiooxydans]MBL5977634.1 NAD-dependent epimerase [Comamonas sp. NyZ500]MDH1332660.1 NAD-dependent epimerase [Comamonas thiooxydans]
MNPVLITGCAGFIGMHCAKRLLEQGVPVLGIDNLNNYYDVALKHARLAELRPHAHFRFVELDLADRQGMADLFAEAAPSKVLHLAAQAGVRYSIDQPDDYTDSNLLGFGNILQGCRKHQVEHLVYASSSSVYGGNTRMPFAESDAVDHPISYYAATKKANELMAHSYAHLYGIPTTGLRFFTVYGPWGRPDMALFKFTKAMLAGESIDVYGEGKLVRDFTYIDDIVEGIMRVLDKPATPDAGYDSRNPNPGTSTAPYRIFNIGNNSPTVLMDYIAALEGALKITARKQMLPIQPGDMHSTSADTRALQAWVGFSPAMPVATGVQHFVDWYRSFYRV